jgi:hypothetical protein
MILILMDEYLRKCHPVVRIIPDKANLLAGTRLIVEHLIEQRSPWILTQVRKKLSTKSLNQMTTTSGTTAGAS